jgi:hypothetical protein
VVVVTVKAANAVPLATGVTKAGATLQVTVAFTGAMLQLKPTDELNPPNEVTVTVAVVEFPATVVTETGETLKA